MSLQDHGMTPDQAQHLQSLAQDIEMRLATAGKALELTDTCYDKCMGAPGNSLSGYETSCLKNCTQAYFQSLEFILEKTREMNPGH